MANQNLEQSIFLHAIGLAALTDRAAYLDEACRDNQELRAELDALLTAHDRLVGAPPPIQTDATGAFTSPTEAASAVIGPYKLIEQIGEGGMGTVWMAQQTEPVKRLVAVKLIKAGMDSKQVIARFEAERQALALMDHANIARVLDAGTTSAGWPYFVMDLVRGMPITKYCDEHHLTPRQRLELFIPVCQAVQHAHQKGIIHRDLKPSNVLVALYDGKPVPKVIDFGVAKAAGQSLTDKTLVTGFGNIVGTIEYMSPEQAEVNQLDIDTRSDIYSLGVLLYELLAGSPPFTRKDLEKAGMLEMLRVIREKEPSKPSTKLSTAEGLSTLAANRGTEPAKLTRLVRGELDWIVMKALEKDRNRRYETANGFAMDVQRYLADEAVQACPPTVGYRLRKFVSRNKGKVLAVGLVLGALVAGVVGTSLGLLEARRQEALAKIETAAKDEALKAEHAAKEREAERAEGERKAKEQAETKHKEAEVNLGYAKKGNDILGSVFTGLDPKAKYETVAELRDALKANLIKAVEQLEGSAIGDPLVVAEMQQKLGQSLLGLGEYNQAIKLFQKCRITFSERQGADHPNTLTSMINLAAGYRDAGKLGLALPLWEETLKLAKTKLGADHPDTLESMNNLAVGYKDAGKLDLALPLYEKSLKLRKAKLGADHPSTLESMNNLAVGYKDAGKLDLALPLYEETLTLKKAKLGADHPDTLTSMNNLALGYQTAGQLDLALPVLEETLKLRKAKLGADHPDTLQSMNNLALGYQGAGKLDLAVPLYEETVKLRKAKLGADHPHTLNSMNNLAAGYRDARKLDLALPLLEETLKLRKAKLGADHPNTLQSMTNLALGYQAAGNLDLALPPLFQEAAVGIEKRRFQHQFAGRIVTSLSACHEQLKQFDQAETWRRKWLAVVKERDGADSVSYAGELAALGSNLLAQKKWTEAETVLRECRAIGEKRQPDAWSNFNTKSMLGGALLGLARSASDRTEKTKLLADAESLLLAGYKGMEQREVKIPLHLRQVRMPEAIERLVQLYEAMEKKDEAAKWRKELEAQKKAAEPTVKPKDK